MQIIETEDEWFKFLNNLEDKILDRGVRIRYHTGEPQEYPCVVYTTICKRRNKQGKFKRIFAKHIFFNLRQAKKLVKISKNLELV